MIFWTYDRRVAKKCKKNERNKPLKTTGKNAIIL